MTMLHRLLALAAAVLLVGGCANGSGGERSGATVSVRHQLDERSNGSTLDARVGDTVVVVLHSTYWNFDTPTTVMQLIGTPEPSPSHCTVVGSGCGTVTATYKAGQVGTVSLHAHRDSCGEAIRCSASNGDWSVTVRVS